MSGWAPADSAQRLRGRCCPAQLSLRDGLRRKALARWSLKWPASAVGIGSRKCELIARGFRVGDRAVAGGERTRYRRTSSILYRKLAVFSRGEAAVRGCPASVCWPDMREAVNWSLYCWLLVLCCACRVLAGSPVHPSRKCRLWSAAGGSAANDGRLPSVHQRPRTTTARGGRHVLNFAHCR